MWLSDGRTNFNRWDKDGDGYVEYKHMRDFLGPYNPDEEGLKAFDTNQDNKYSLNEMLAAMGFPEYVPPVINPEDEFMDSKWMMD